MERLAGRDQQRYDFQPVQDTQIPFSRPSAEYSEKPRPRRAFSQTSTPQPSTSIAIAMRGDPSLQLAASDELQRIDKGLVAAKRPHIELASHAGSAVAR